MLQAIKAWQRSLLNADILLTQQRESAWGGGRTHIMAESMGSDAAELMPLCAARKLCTGVGILRSCLKPDGGLATFGDGELRCLSRKSSGAAKDSSATYNSEPALATTYLGGFRLLSLSRSSSKDMSDPLDTLGAT